MTHQMTLGALEISFLQFAHAKRTAEQLATVFPDMSNAARQSVASDYPDGYPWSFTGLLIRAGDTVFLVDTGFSFSGSDHGTATRDLIAQAGCESKDITSVILTHGHGDHIGGLVADGAPAFPQAELIVSETERRHWLASGEGAAHDALTIYHDQTRAIEQDELIFQDSESQVRALPSPGHTPGHIGLDIESQGMSLWFLADVAHALIQLSDPSLSPKFDTDPQQAARTRQRVFQDAASRNQLVALFHFPFPGIGVIQRTDDGFQFVPHPER